MIKANPNVSLRQAGDESWQDYRAMLLRFILSRVPDATAAEDIVQEVMIKAFHHAGDLEDATKLRAWLYQIARNAMIDFFRAQEKTAQFDERIFQVEESDSGVHEAEKEMAACLKPLLLMLPQEYREAILLTEFEGKTQRVAAEELGLSLSGMKSRVQRGRKRLLAMLQECCEIELDSRGHVVAFEAKGSCDDCDC